MTALTALIALTAQTTDTAYTDGLVNDEVEHDPAHFADAYRRAAAAITRQRAGEDVDGLLATAECVLCTWEALVVVGSRMAGDPTGAAAGGYHQAMVSCGADEDETRLAWAQADTH